MNKIFQYKVYKPQVETVINRIYQGDFEGDYAFTHSSLWNKYWTSMGTPTTVDRYRKDSKYGTTSTKGFRCGGNRRLLVSAAVGSVNSNVASTKVAIMSIWSYANWSVSGLEYLFNCAFDATAKQGYGIFINYSSGYISAVAGDGTTVYEAKYLLSSLSSGAHTIGMKYSVSGLVLNIDGTDVATTVTAGNDIYFPAGSFSMFIGSSYNVVNPTGISTGDVHHIAIYNNSVSANLPTTTMFQNYAANYSTQYNPSNSATFPSLVFNFSDLIDGSTSIADSMRGYIISVGNQALFGPAITTPSVLSQGTCVKIVTSVGGSATQGITHSVIKPAITGGNTYTASAWVKGPAGETANLAIVPVGGGSTQSKAITLDGTWQRVALTYASNAAATNLEVQIYLSNANASAKTFYVDAVMLEDGATLHDYFNDSTPDNLPYAYYYSNSSLRYHVARLKTYSYIKTWNDVSSDFEKSQEINASGSGDVRVELARSYYNTGEGVDVDFNNRVVVQCISDDYPNGQTIYIGRIVDYKPVIKNEEYAEVTLLGYGEDMAQYTIEAGASDVFRNDANTAGAAPIGCGYGSVLFMGFSYTTASDQTDISEIGWYGKGTVVVPTMQFQVQIWDTRPDVSLPNYGTTKPLYSGFMSGWPSTSNSWISHTLVDSSGNPVPLQVNPSTRYYITATPLQYDTVNPIVYFETSPNNPTASDYIFQYTSVPIIDNTRMLTCYVKQSYGATKVPCNSMDPSTILKKVIDDYNRQGGELKYDSTTIELTGTVVNYTFNANNIFQGLQQCLTLAPAYWYFYIDEATNMVHFHPKSSATVHTLTLGVDFESLELLKRLETIVNTIYFTGGDNPLNPGVNIFREYRNQASIDKYGKRAIPYADARVTVPSTMKIMAEAILDQNPVPEIQTPLTILAGKKNIEAVRPGDVIKFRGFSNKSTNQLDIGTADGTLYLDADITNPETYRLQIARYDYNPDKLSTTLSSTPPDVNKRVEDIKRNLDAQLVLDNPTTPVLDV